MGIPLGWTIDDEEEVFVPCPDYPEQFDIGSKGTLRSRRTGKVLSQTPDHSGYLRHASKIGGRKGKAICVRVHVQVAKAFVGRESDDLEVNHLSGDKTKNDYTQLEWTTHQDNMLHAVSMGLIAPKKGVESSSASLTTAQVDEIRSLKGKYSQRKLAEMYGVEKTTIGRIHRNTRYNDD